MERELLILNGGDPIELNGFVKSIVTGAILGMLQSLHGIDMDREIRITISSAEASKSSGRP
jgi:hypothetical protein